MPQDWFDIVRNAKRRNPRFTVVEMQRHEFKSTAALEEAVSNRKKDIDNGPVNWLKIRWLRFEKGQECILSFKESLNDVLPFRKVNLTKKRNVGRPLSSLLNIQQESLYNDRRLVTLEKKKICRTCCLTFLQLATVFSKTYRKQLSPGKLPQHNQLNWQTMK